jgi:hypothetical protein
MDRIGGTLWDVRLVGTAVVCVLAAFGAAFLVARAVNHQTPAKAAATVRDQPVAAVTTATATTPNAELVSEFTPVSASLKHKPRPPKRHPVHHSAPPASSAAGETSAPTDTQQSTTPYTPPPTTPSPVTSAPSSGSSGSSGSSHHQHSSGGSGTTTIGG